MLHCLIAAKMLHQGICTFQLCASSAVLDMIYLWTGHKYYIIALYWFIHATIATFMSFNTSVPTTDLPCAPWLTVTLYIMSFILSRNHRIASPIWSMCTCFHLKTSTWTVKSSHGPRGSTQCMMKMTRSASSERLY